MKRTWQYAIAGGILALSGRRLAAGEFGIRLEDCLQITESGPKMLTPQSPTTTRPV